MLGATKGSPPLLTCSVSSVSLFPRDPSWSRASTRSALMTCCHVDVRGAPMREIVKGRPALRQAPPAKRCPGRRTLKKQRERASPTQQLIPYRSSEMLSLQAIMTVTVLPLPPGIKVNPTHVHRRREGPTIHDDEGGRTRGPRDKGGTLRNPL